ncbi:MAG: DNA-binding protein [Hadesarchaea archaeon]|nr:DNA-binding protein [Hadesarchaea archaeon]
MKASEVKPGMRSIDLELEVIEKSDPHSFVSNKSGEGRVSTAVCEDDSGEIKVSLWNEDIDKVEEGDQIRIKDGYSRLFQDEVHVSAGKYGELEVIGEGKESKST